MEWRSVLVWDEMLLIVVVDEAKGSWGAHVCLCTCTCVVCGAIRSRSALVQGNRMFHIHVWMYENMGRAREELVIGLLSFYIIICKEDPTLLSFACFFERRNICYILRFYNKFIPEFTFGIHRKVQRLARLLVLYNAIKLLMMARAMRFLWAFASSNFNPPSTREKEWGKSTYMRANLVVILL